MTTLIVPGLNDSGPDHWQTWLEARIPGAIRVRQRDWTQADLPEWSARVASALDERTEPAILVCHSFGCLAAVHAAAVRPQFIAGALLVAPADPDKWNLSDVLPQAALPFPSILVASRNDPWLRFEAAAQWAKRWGSRLVDLGHAGHVNADSGFGPWPLGLRLLDSVGRIPGDGHHPCTASESGSYHSSRPIPHSTFLRE